jgi:hypothetical protein
MKFNIFWFFCHKLASTIVDSSLNRTTLTIYATIVRLLAITTEDLPLDRTAPTVYERFMHI